MEYELTPTENHLVEMLSQKGMSEDIILWVMVALPNEQEQQEMITYLEQNPEARQEDILDLTAELSTVIEEAEN